MLGDHRSRDCSFVGADLRNSRSWVTYGVWAAVWVAMIWGRAAVSFLRKDL